MHSTYGEVEREKRGYIDEAKYWRYSSARDYEGEEGLLDIDRFW